MGSDRTLAADFSVTGSEPDARRTSPGKAFLLVDRDGVVGQSGDALRLQIGLQPVAVVALDHI